MLGINVSGKLCLSFNIIFLIYRWVPLLHALHAFSFYQLLKANGSSSVITTAPHCPPSALKCEASRATLFPVPMGERGCISSLCAFLCL